MQYLTLVRHGEAEWRESSAADFGRPLTRRGLAEAADAASRLRAQGVPLPDVVLTSPAARALETAETLARELGIAPRFVARIDVLYLATPDLLASVVNGADARIGHLLLVGHNPGISEYARRLAPEIAPRSLPTGACVTLHCGAEGWQAVAADS